MDGVSSGNSLFRAGLDVAVAWVDSSHQSHVPNRGSHRAECSSMYEPEMRPWVSGGSRSVHGKRLRTGQGHDQLLIIEIRSTLHCPPPVDGCHWATHQRRAQISTWTKTDSAGDRRGHQLKSEEKKGSVLSWDTHEKCSWMSGKGAISPP